MFVMRRRRKPCLSHAIMFVMLATVMRQSRTMTNMTPLVRPKGMMAPLVQKY